MKTLSLKVKGLMVRKVNPKLALLLGVVLLGVLLFGLSAVALAVAPVSYSWAAPAVTATPLPDITPQEGMDVLATAGILSIITAFFVLRYAKRFINSFAR